jgi:hypothetical protein
MLAGSPDWNASTAFDGHAAFAAWERPATFVVPPTALVARRHDGSPALRLDRYRQDRDRDGLAEFSLLSLAFAVDTHLPTPDDAQGTDALGFHPMRVERGWIRLDPVGALHLPDAVRELQPLDIAGGGSMTMGLRLDSAATELFIGALRRGMAIVNADAWCRVRGVAARHPLSLSVDPPALLAGLRAIGSDAASSTDALEIPIDVLRDVLLADPARLGLAPLGQVPDRDRAQVVQAFLDRCAARFAETVPGPRDGRVHLRFEPARMGPAQLRWSLDEVLLVPRMFALAADPLGPLRNLDAATLERDVLREHIAPALDSGWHAIAVHANVPQRRIGLLRTQVELIAPARPPARPFASKAALPLPDGRSPVITTLRLAPSEPLAYRWHTQAYIADAGRVTMLPGPVRESTRELLVIGMEDFDLSLVNVDCEPSFLSEASVIVQVEGTRHGRVWSLSAKLERDAPAVAFAVPRDVVGATLSATAEALAGDARATMAPIPLEALTLDAFSFEGSGARALDVEGRFGDDSPQILVEVVPEGREREPARVRLLRLTPAASRERWTWMATSPLRPGYRWRRYGETQWSPVMSAASPLIVHSSSAPGAAQGANMERMIEDAVLSPVPGETNAWHYRARHPGIAADGGTPQMSLISAGGIHMLSLTAIWGVPSAQLEAARKALAAETGIDAARIELRPSPHAVGEVVLRFGDGAGGWEDAARTQSSGMPPYHAAFSLMLDDARADKVRRALGGETGLFGVAYAWTLSGGAHTTTASTDSVSARIDASVEAEGDLGHATFSADETVATRTTTGGGATRGEAFADAAGWRMRPP